MMRILVSLLSAVIFMGAFGGCSTKQVNDTVDSVTGDIKNFGEKVTEEH